MACKTLVPEKLGENRKIRIYLLPQVAVCRQPLLDTGESEQKTYRMGGLQRRAPIRDYTLLDTKGSSLAMQLRRKAAVPAPLLSEQRVLVPQMALSLVIACPGCI